MDQTLGIPEIIEQKRTEILRLAKLYGAYHVRVFGSIARHEATPDSDVDILVEFEAGRSLVDLVGLKQDLESLLERRVDLVVEKTLKEALRDLILQDCVSL